MAFKDKALYGGEGCVAEQDCLVCLEEAALLSSASGHILPFHVQTTNTTAIFVC